ncbi:zf-TFIIB domain-containing protein [Microterricola viridarii]
MDEFDTPNCPNCLHRMEPADQGKAAVWRCPECRMVKV